MEMTAVIADDNPEMLKALADLLSPLQSEFVFMFLAVRLLLKCSSRRSLGADCPKLIHSLKKEAGQSLVSFELIKASRSHQKHASATVTCSSFRGVCGRRGQLARAVVFVTLSFP
jgi:hypothetical protein